MTWHHIEAGLELRDQSQDFKDPHPHNQNEWIKVYIDATDILATGPNIDSIETCPKYSI